MTETPPDRTEPDPTSPPPDPGFWSRPVTRGLMNGVVFAAMLCVIQVLGWFRPSKPLDDESVVANLMAGAVFGFAVYILAMWRLHRQARRAGDAS